MQAWILLFCLGLIGVSCVPQYSDVSEEELIAMELKAQVESVGVDFNNLRDRGVAVNNRGDRIHFRVYAEWVSNEPQPGVAALNLDSAFLYSQELPRTRDSIFKEKGSRVMRLYQFNEKRFENIRIVPREQMEKATKLNLRSQ